MKPGPSVRPTTTNPPSGSSAASKRFVGLTAEVGRDDAVVPEAGIEIAVGVVAREREVDAAAHGATAGSDDAAVGLDEDGFGLAGPTTVDTLPSLPNVGSRPEGGAGGAQSTAMSVTSAPVTVPAPLLTVQTWSGSLGWVATVTS